MSAKASALKLIGGIVIGAAGAKWFETKNAKTAGAYTIAGAKIAAGAIKDGFEKVQAGYGDLNADADEITKKYYEKKDAASENKAE